MSTVESLINRLYRDTIDFDVFGILISAFGDPVSNNKDYNWLRAIMGTNIVLYDALHNVYDHYARALNNYDSADLYIGRCDLTIKYDSTADMYTIKIVPHIIFEDDGSYERETVLSHKMKTIIDVDREMVSTILKATLDTLPIF